MFYTMISTASGCADPCFLCQVPAELSFWFSENFVALVGLGPLVQDYSLIAAQAHVKSMADVPLPVRDEQNRFLAAVRAELEARHGTCLVTEHGRMAVCVDHEHDSHCFHAHLLAFPGVDDISDLAESYFSSLEKFKTLGAALEYAGTLDEYLFVSPKSDQFNIFAGPLNVPRQLARYLVGCPPIFSIASTPWKG
jgi:hypothetical protein